MTERFVAACVRTKPAMLVGIATVYRYIREAEDVLAALAPTPAEAMRLVRTKVFVILDGTLPPIDRIAADTPYYSGELTDPFGRLLWASPALPGSTHDRTSTRTHGIVEALTDADLKCWANRHTRAPAAPSGCPSATVASNGGSAATTAHTPRSAASASRPWPPSRAGASYGSSAAAPTPGRPRPSPRVSVRLEEAHWPQSTMLVSKYLWLDTRSPEGCAWPRWRIPLLRASWVARSQSGSAMRTG